jgi:hypothetical protein
MSPARRCRCCGRPFRPRPQNPTQTYCSERACQRARNARRGVGAIAKEDASPRESVLPSGTYRVEPWCGADCKCGRVSGENLFSISRIERL